MTSRLLTFAALAFLTVNPTVALLDIKDICKQTPGMTVWGQILEENPSILAIYGTRTNLTLYIPSNDALAQSYQTSYLHRRDAAGQAAANAGFSATDSYNTISNMAAGDMKQITLQGGDNGNQLANVAGPSSSSIPRLAKRGGAPAPQPPGVQVYTGLGNTSSILFGDILCKQGVAHVVNSVFTLPVKVTETLKTLGLTKFQDAVEDACLTEKLEGANQITMFVPENCGIDGKLDADAIEKHIVLGSALYGDSLHDGNKFKSASGKELCVTVKGGRIYIDDILVTQKNIILRNGVVHTLAKSLYECDECEPEEEEEEVYTTHRHSETATATPVHRSYRG